MMYSYLHTSILVRLYAESMMKNWLGWGAPAFPLLVTIENVPGFLYLVYFYMDYSYVESGIAPLRGTRRYIIQTPNSV